MFSMQSFHSFSLRKFTRWCQITFPKRTLRNNKMKSLQYKLCGTSKEFCLRAISIWEVLFSFIDIFKLIRSLLLHSVNVAGVKFLSLRIDFRSKVGVLEFTFLSDQADLALTKRLIPNCYAINSCRHLPVSLSGLYQLQSEEISFFICCINPKS